MIKPSIPSRENAEDLDSLSESFRPANVKYLLSLDSQYSLEECMECANGMLQRIKRFADNGFSVDGTDLPYTSVKEY